ncbi:MAG: hypothetical protein KC442_10500, partial [Thermomicrobiales bacterium]|nr:hypothetical protein [Thermomicrobiales bacterium]
AAKDRRRRRKARHRNRRKKRQHTGKRKHCKAKSRTRVCAGTCGVVKNNCGKKVDCGPCACEPACGPCSTCDAATGACVASCTADQLCIAGVCTTCDVTCAAQDHVCDGAALQSKITDGGTIYVCPGRYIGGYSVPSGVSVSLIGAGMGDDPAANTILDANHAGRVITTSASTSLTVGQMRLVNGAAYAAAGIYIDNTCSLEMTDVVITECVIDGGSGGAIFAFGKTELTGCLLSANTGAYSGGAIYSNAEQVILRNTEIRGNSAEYGGGLAINDGSLSLLEGSRVTRNQATQPSGGGGIRTGNGTAVTISADSLVFDNDPDDCSGAGTVTGTCGTP